ncbi:hypothetical protein MAR_029345 [Mya arenaria]|uniref:Uncharacterized protein n=1 Tax=Mya arenaria TaxID=6604 RepID=A0ABY7DJY5_MYAAR|nr:hypothetical protein MAR_029345 [Mya arenaria]
MLLNDKMTDNDKISVACKKASFYSLLSINIGTIISIKNLYTKTSFRSRTLEQSNKIKLHAIRTFYTIGGKNYSMIPHSNTNRYLFSDVRLETYRKRNKFKEAYVPRTAMQYADIGAYKTDLQQKTSLFLAGLISLFKKDLFQTL